MHFEHNDHQNYQCGKQKYATTSRNTGNDKRLCEQSSITSSLFYRIRKKVTEMYDVVNYSNGVKNIKSSSFMKCEVRVVNYFLVAHVQFFSFFEFGCQADEANESD